MENEPEIYHVVPKFSEEFSSYRVFTYPYSYDRLSYHAINSRFGLKTLVSFGRIAKSPGVKDIQPLSML